jgi:ribosome-associated protein
VAVKRATKSKIVKAGAEQLVDAIVYGMEEVKAHDIVVMDLRKVPNALSDFFVVCHGTSNTQVQAIADSVEKETFRMLQDEPAHREGARNATWILMDYVNVVVHIFSKDARDFYALEDLWADASVKRIGN